MSWAVAPSVSLFLSTDCQLISTIDVVYADMGMQTSSDLVIKW